jgi:hypothetical protein
MSKVGLFGAIAVLAFGTAAQAQTCEAYVGTTIQPRTFDAVAAIVKTVPNQKDEFETTVAYDARVQAALAKLPGDVIIGAPFDPKYATYDADTGQFVIKSYAIRNINTDYAGVFGYGTPFDGKVKFSYSSSNLDVVLSQSEVATGSYVASNSYGASTKVTKIARTTKAIFDRESPRYGQSLFDSLKDSVLFRLPVSPEEARALKTSFKGAFVISPKAPFFTVGKGRGGDVTISNPYDVDESIHVIIADIKCALVTDATGKVLAAAGTN